MIFYPRLGEGHCACEDLRSLSAKTDYHPIVTDLFQTDKSYEDYKGLYIILVYIFFITEPKKAFHVPI